MVDDNGNGRSVVCVESEMSAYFAHSSHMPCPDCGASVRTGAHAEHACDPERAHGYQLFPVREEVARLGSGIAAFLDSPHGRFAQWLAERERGPR